MEEAARSTEDGVKHRTRWDARVPFIVRILLLFLIAFTVSVAQAQEKRISLFSGTGGSGFWPILERFANAAAHDLGVKLTVHDFGNNPVRLVAEMEKLSRNPANHPDGVLFYNFKNRGADVLELLEKAQIPSILINAGFFDGRAQVVPRETHRMLIGEILPDDEQAGHILMARLFEMARRLPENTRAANRQDNVIHVVALEGNRSSAASNLRTQGLQSFLKSHPQLLLRQYFHTRWNEQHSMEVFKHVRNRYPEVSLFWCASDSMARGVIKAAEQEGLRPGRDFVVGGIDLLPETERLLAEHRGVVSVGGHYAEGAWGVIALFDYLNGNDFFSAQGTHIRTGMEAMSQSDTENISLSALLSETNLRKIDFRQFSRTFNPEVAVYPFHFRTLVNQLRKKLVTPIKSVP